LRFLQDFCTFNLWLQCIQRIRNHSSHFPLKPIRRCKAKKIPEFKTEAEERAFWESHDSSEFVDWTKARLVSLPKLKPSTKTISLRLPETLLDRIRIEANKRDMPYQSLIKAWLAEDVERSFRH
jgi:predicted DNA binding CopG/RHH family protein